VPGRNPSLNRHYQSNHRTALKHVTQRKTDRARTNPNDEPTLERVGIRKRSTYAIGDVQGCFDDLLRLLEKVDFDPGRDRLWFTGDLVNRGPNSLEILRFVKNLAGSAITVLGNHDMHLLAVAAGAVEPKRKDTINEVLAADDCEELLFWLRHQPLLHHDTDLGYTMIHAGLPPQWDLVRAQACAHELEAVLQNSDYEMFFRHMLGDKPRRWSKKLSGWERLRFISRCFTELRYCDSKGRLVLAESAKSERQAKSRIPWFQIPNRANRQLKILFGHWASLTPDSVRVPGVFPLDSGCAYRGRFTALRLEDGRSFRVRCYNERYL